jgi:glycine cleavage system pyridoxal-binding protein P
VSQSSLRDLEQSAPFAGRHIGPTEDEQAKMLAVVGYGSVEDLANAAVPDCVCRRQRPSPRSSPSCGPSRWRTP